MMWGSLEDFTKEIVMAIIIALLGFICGKIYKLIRSFLFKKTMSFSLDGLWFSRHNNYQGEDIIELIFFKHDRENVSVKIVQYKKLKQDVYSFLGKGIFTTDIISLFYYSICKHMRQNGVMTLKILTHNINDIFMSGTYYEINSERAKNQGLYPFGTYEVYKLKLPFFKNIELKLRRDNFLNYDKVDDLIKKYGDTK